MQYYIQLRVQSNITVSGTIKKMFPFGALCRITYYFDFIVRYISFSLLSNSLCYYRKFSSWHTWPIWQWKSKTSQIKIAFNVYIKEISFFPGLQSIELNSVVGLQCFAIQLLIFYDCLSPQSTNLSFVFSWLFHQQ